MKYQIYTRDDTGHLLHAGVHELGKVSRHTIRKLERKWQIWRREYVTNHPGNYPLALECQKKPDFVSIFPVNSPQNVRTFSL